MVTEDDISVAPPEVTFTTEDWDTPQIFTVTVGPRRRILPSGDPPQCARRRLRINAAGERHYADVPQSFAPAIAALHVGSSAPAAGRGAGRGRCRDGADHRHARRRSTIRCHHGDGRRRQRHGAGGNRLRRGGELYGSDSSQRNTRSRDVCAGARERHAGRTGRDGDGRWNDRRGRVDRPRRDAHGARRRRPAAADHRGRRGRGRHPRDRVPRAAGSVRAGGRFRSYARRRTVRRRRPTTTSRSVACSRWNPDKRPPRSDWR